MQDKPLTPLRSIRRKCIECSGDSPKEVRLCQTQECPLFEFRLGRNPHRRGIGGRKAFSTPESPSQVEMI